MVGKADYVRVDGVVIRELDWLDDLIMAAPLVGDCYRKQNESKQPKMVCRYCDHRHKCHQDVAAGGKATCEDYVVIELGGQLVQF